MPEFCKSNYTTDGLLLSSLLALMPLVPRLIVCFRFLFLFPLAQHLSVVSFLSSLISAVTFPFMLFPFTHRGEGEADMNIHIQTRRRGREGSGLSLDRRVRPCVQSLMV